MRGSCPAFGHGPGSDAGQHSQKSLARTSHTPPTPTGTRLCRACTWKDNVTLESSTRLSPAPFTTAPLTLHPSTTLSLPPITVTAPHYSVTDPSLHWLRDTQNSDSSSLPLLSQTPHCCRSHSTVYGLFSFSIEGLVRERRRHISLHSTCWLLKK